MAFLLSIAQGIAEMKWVPEEATEMISSLRREQREAHLQCRICPLPAGAELGSGDPGKELWPITPGNYPGDQGRVGEGTAGVTFSCSAPIPCGEGLAQGDWKPSLPQDPAVGSPSPHVRKTGWHRRVRSLFQGKGQMPLHFCS